MKVIVAGMPKTGTKSMNAALTQLGYKVYDFDENIFLLADDYARIVNKGWTTEDFQRMYENVDAVVDFPAHFFWEEIHRAFPSSKIILTVRDSEEQWVRSFMNQAKENTASWLWFLLILSPTAIKIMMFMDGLYMTAFGTPTPTKFRKSANEAMLKRMYRAHNAYVEHAAPKDKLLVYKCADGWEPLCQFLGVPVPNGPFPHKNIGGSIVKDFVKFRGFRKMRREVIISLVVLASASALTGFLLYNYSWSGIRKGVKGVFAQAICKV